MPHRDADHLGTLVRPARERRRWTQQQLADALGIDKGYVSAIEIGTRKWPRDHVEQLAETLGLDLVEMAIAAKVLPDSARRVRRVEDDFGPDDPGRELLAILRDADYADRKELLDYAMFKVKRRVPKSTPEHPDTV